MKKSEAKVKLKPAARNEKTEISEWSGGERSEPKRNGESSVAKISPEGTRPEPNPEVLDKPKRRRFRAEYKTEIVQAAARCTEPGQIGALLRREGLYSSQLAEWRKQYRASAHAGLQEKRRGRKPKQSALEKENERLWKENKRLEERLDQAYEQYPERFVRKPPRVERFQQEVWINPPERTLDI